MNSYELTLVLSPEEKEADKTLVKIKGWIEAGKGKLSKIDKTGLKDFAYPIKKLSKGNYLFSILEIDPKELSAVERRLRIEPSILRYLLVRI